MYLPKETPRSNENPSHAASEEFEAMLDVDKIKTPGNFCLPASSNQLTCVDLFAGAGGFSLAAIKANLNLIAAVELNKHACDSYRANLIESNKFTKNSPTLYSENILNLPPENLKQAHFTDKNSCDIVLGGPPCQGFSVHRINNSGVEDPRNALILRYFEYVKCLNPKVFLMENVPGLLWPRHKKYLDDFLMESNKAGYRILGPIKLDARDYGIPQRRIRVFVLGIRRDIIFNDSLWPPAPTHGDIQSTKDSVNLRQWVNSAQVFSMPDIVNDENCRHMQHSAELINVFQGTPINGGSRKDSSRTLPCHAKHNGHSDVYGRINPSEPAPTMTTACINPSKGRFVHPTENHGITIRQAARFQTFPDNYIFKGGLMAAGVQIGNAVPIELGDILLRTISLGLNVDPDS